MRSTNRDGEFTVIKNTTSVSRRSFLKSTAALGLGAVAAPALVSRSALASSGELNYMG
ncbi:MAG: twin-arginine translocation signal domain-containing protein, partial [Pseudomonadota bacterium]